MSGCWWDEPVSVLLPGRPEGVDGLSASLKATGESIATQASRLRGVNADIWKGEAAAKFTEHITSTPGQLDLLATRYGGVASALSTYASDLRSAQSKVAQAKERARQAHADQVAATQAISDTRAANTTSERSAQQQNADFPDQPPIVPSLTALGPLQARAGDAADAMDEAERLRAEADSDRDRSAASCRKTIDGCVDDDLKNQGGFFGWVKHTFKKIAPILAAVAAVVGIAALFIPGLNLIALGLAVACLVVDSANYFVFDQGDLQTVALDLVGVAAFAGVLKAARAARTAQTATTTSRAATASTSAPAVLNRAGTSSSVAPQVVRGGAGPVRAGQQGLRHLGFTQNTQRIRLPGGGYRVPDVLDEAAGVIGEVKNVQRLSYTAQLRDYVAYAQAASPPLQFDLYVRGSTKLSGPLQEAARNGTINLMRRLP